MTHATYKQFAFYAEARNRKCTEVIRATAKTAEEAREAIAYYYNSDFIIADLPYDVRAAHYFLGEVDCT